MLCYKMSLVLLQTVDAYIQSMIDGLKKNDSEMAKNKSDIEKINGVIAALKAKIALQDDINAEIHDITDAEINDLQVSDALQVAVDVEAAVVIVDLQAEIMALKAKIAAHETINSEANEIINYEVDNLQEDVKELQVNDKKNEAEKAIALAAEIAILEAQLLALNMALNVVKPATHPELFLGDSDGTEDTNNTHPLLM
jgi:hypothetical protein